MLGLPFLGMVSWFVAGCCLHAFSVGVFPPVLAIPGVLALVVAFVPSLGCGVPLQPLPSAWGVPPAWSGFLSRSSAFSDFPFGCFGSGPLPLAAFWPVLFPRFSPFWGPCLVPLRGPGWGAPPCLHPPGPFVCAGLSPLGPSLLRALALVVRFPSSVGSFAVDCGPASLGGCVPGFGSPFPGFFLLSTSASCLRPVPGLCFGP